MFICNFKLDHKFIFKIAFVFLFIIVLVIAGLAIYKVFDYTKSGDEMPIPDVANITSDNYTNILKSVHENLDDYLGQKITFSGYVYRVYDFNETQFVLARNMIISSDNQSVVVGFLCNYKKASEFVDGSWVTITGKITKGDYHGEIPILEITEMKPCDKPSNEFVTPPDDTYIPTSILF